MGEGSGLRIHNVEDGVNAIDPGNTFGRECRRVNDVASEGPFAPVALQGVVLDAGEDQEEKNRDAHAGCAEYRHEGNMLEGSG